MFVNLAEQPSVKCRQGRKHFYSHFYFDILYWQRRRKLLEYSYQIRRLTHLSRAKQRHEKSRSVSAIRTNYIVSSSLGKTPKRQWSSVDLISLPLSVFLQIRSLSIFLGESRRFICEVLSEEHVWSGSVYSMVFGARPCVRKTNTMCCDSSYYHFRHWATP